MSRARIQAIVRQFAQNGMKLLLEDPRNVRELLTVSNVTMVRQIDFDRMTRLRTSFVQRDYRHVEADVVLRAPLRQAGKSRGKRAITIYILIEHQSDPDPTMALRVLEYVLAIYKAQAREWGRRHHSFAGLRLCPVLPIVFYTGSRAWDKLAQFADLIEVSDEIPSMIPALDPLFLNLSKVPADALESSGGFGWVLRLVQERSAQAASFRDLLHRVVEHLAGIPPTERLRWLELLSYVQAFVYYERNVVEHAGLQQEIEASIRSDDPLQEEISRMRRTMADVLIDRGKKQARIEVRRQILLDLLRERFGVLPENIVAAVQSNKSVQELNIWLRRFATATTLEEVGVGR